MRHISGLSQSEDPGAEAASALPRFFRVVQHQPGDRRLVPLVRPGDLTRQLIELRLRDQLLAASDLLKHSALQPHEGLLQDLVVQFVLVDALRTLRLNQRDGFPDAQRQVGLDRRPPGLDGRRGALKRGAVRARDETSRREVVDGPGPVLRWRPRPQRTPTRSLGTSVPISASRQFPQMWNSAAGTQRRRGTVDRSPGAVRPWGELTEREARDLKPHSRRGRRFPIWGN